MSSHQAQGQRTQPQPGHVAQQGSSSNITDPRLDEDVTLWNAKKPMAPEPNYPYIRGSFWVRECCLCRKWYGPFMDECKNPECRVPGAVPCENCPFWYWDGQRQDYTRGGLKRLPDDALHPLHPGRRRMGEAFVTELSTEDPRRQQRAEGAPQAPGQHLAPLPPPPHQGQPPQYGQQPHPPVQSYYPPHPQHAQQYMGSQQQQQYTGPLHQPGQPHQHPGQQNPGLYQYQQHPGAPHPPQQPPQGYQYPGSGYYPNQQYPPQ